MHLPFEGNIFAGMPVTNESRIILKVSRCTADMLSQILYYKTQDVGKKC
jgi:hypothetical protein